MNALLRLLIYCALIFFCAEKSPAATQTPETSAKIAFQEINAYRAKHQLAPLIWNDKMASIADQQSRLMAVKKISFGHGGAGKRFEELRKSIPDLNAYGENIAYNYERSNLAEHIVDNWIKSSSHRENIVDDFTHTGVGAFRNKDGYTYITQVFGRIENPSPQKSPNIKKVIFNPPVKPR